MNKREHDYFRRFDCLMSYAQKDAEFCKAMLQLHSISPKAHRIMGFLPKGIRNILLEYADLRAGAMRRMAMIACMCMEFTGEKPFSFEKVQHQTHGTITFTPPQKNK